jgi:hypothetical protein
MTDYVYFIEADNGLVKIGKTKNVRLRISSLRSSSPIPLRLLHVIDCNGNATRIEKYFHDLYKSKRRHGEWFSFVMKEKKEITKIDTDGMKGVEMLNGEDPVCPDCLKSVNGRRGLISHERFCEGLPVIEPRRATQYRRW